MWQVQNRALLTARAAFTHVCLCPASCYGLVTTCEWDQRVSGKIKKEAIFIIKAAAARCEGRRLSHKWRRVGGGGSWKAWPCSPRLLLSLPPAHLIALSSEDNIRHAAHDGRVGGRVISDIIFLLSTYLHSELPPSFSVSAAKWLASLCPDKCPSQGIFSPFVSRWGLLVL